MTALTNFNNFELNTEETKNVNGGWGCYSYSRSYSYSNYYSNCYGSYSNCYGSYSNCYSNNTCEPVKEETVVEAAPVIETPVVEAPESLTPPRGGVAGL